MRKTILASVLLALAGCSKSGQQHNAGSNSSKTSSSRSSADHQKRLQWNRKTLVEDYKQHGNHDPKWDSAAKEALEQFANIRAHAEHVPDFQRQVPASVKNPV